jgi:hypothetical protein
MLDRFKHVPRPVRYALVAAGAFVLGSATIASASTTGFPIGSLFYIAQLNGVATTPCDSTTTEAGNATTCHAVVDAKGQVATSDADTHAALAKNQYDAGGNLKVTSQGSSTISGSVSVNNLPAVQQVAFPVSNKSRGLINFSVPPQGVFTQVINLTVTFVRTGNCETGLVLTDGSTFTILTAGDLSFPGGLAVDHINVLNPGSIPCDGSFQMVGY